MGPPVPLPLSTSPVLAPSSRSSRAMAPSPLWHATIRAVLPCAVHAFTSAECSSSSRATSSRDALVAASRAVSPFLSAMLGDARASSSSWAIEQMPCMHTAYSAVAPPSPGAALMSTTSALSSILRTDLSSFAVAAR